jgi:hypothetical protein
VFTLAATSLAACGGSNEPPPKDPSSIEAILANPTEATDAESSHTEASPKASGSRLNTAQKEQMEIALRRGEAKAAQCPDVVPNSPTGEGEVQVVFDGEKGKVIDAIVGPPFAGTPAAACVKRAFVNEIIVPFDGEPITVPFTVKIPARALPADEKATKDKKK